MTLVVGYIVGCACYGLATSFAIRFNERLTVASAAAFAPAVAWSAFAQRRPVLLFVPVLFAGLVLILRRRPLVECATHAALFGAVVAVVVVTRIVGVDEVLVPSLIGGVVYLTADYALQRRTAALVVLAVGQEPRTWWLLQGVLLCACGLTGLGVEQMDWPAFVAMAGVLVLTKREFEAFAQSREAYQQTLRALEKLQQRGSAIWASTPERPL